MQIRRRTERRSLVASTSFNFSTNLLKENMLFHTSSSLKIKYGKSKRYSRKSIYHGCMVWIEKSVTRDHCSASLGKPISDPRDRFFYPHHTPMIDTYFLTYETEVVLFSAVLENSVLPMG